VESDFKKEKINEKNVKIYIHYEFKLVKTFPQSGLPGKPLSPDYPIFAHNRMQLKKGVHSYRVYLMTDSGFTGYKDQLLISQFRINVTSGG